MKNLISEPVYASNDSVSSFLRHEAPSGLYSICMQKYQTFLDTYKGKVKPINVLLDTVKKKTK